MTNPRFVPTRLLQMQKQLYTMGDLTPELIAYTRDFGLDHKVMQAHAGVFAVVLAKFWRDDIGQAIFEFDPEGVPSAVFEAILLNGDREPYVADLVAWPLHDPFGFGTALGPREGADVLGAFHMPQRGATPLIVHRTPLAWLHADCEGCVPLNEAGGRYWLDKAGGPFAVRDVGDGRWLRDFLGPVASRHRIIVACEELAA